MASATVKNLSGENERVSLPNPHFTTDPTGQQDFTGVWIAGLYSGPRTGRRFARTYSIWQRSHNDSRITGTRIHELTESEYLDYCRRVGVDPVHVEAVEV